MKVVMLAAGLGSRLGQPSAEIGPKVLMQFGGKSLLEKPKINGQKLRTR